MNAAPPVDSRPRVAVLFSRFGPYHLARLRGASAALERAGGQLAAIAVAGTDRVYDWHPVHAPATYPSAVLFPDSAYEQIHPRDLVHRLRARLDAFDPVAVALPGWSFVEAKAGLAWCRANGRAAILMTESARGDHFRLWPREIAKQVLVRKFHAALVGGGSHAEYARALGIPRACIFHGYDAVDNEYFIQHADQVRAGAAGVRAAAGLPPRYWLSSSRFVSKKNIDGLCAATRCTPRDIRTRPRWCSAAMVHCVTI
jgi:1,2-diacylglycerol 3-alpha-glucosyltransferase